MVRISTRAGCAMAGVALVMAAAASAQSQSPRADWRTFHEAGRKAMEQGRYAEAERNFKSAVIATQSLPDRDMTLAATYGELAALFYHEGRYREAESLIAWS